MVSYFAEYLCHTMSTKIIKTPVDIKVSGGLYLGKSEKGVYCAVVR
jgi:hypothetical protein